MDRDLRASDAYRRTEDHFTKLLSPGFGQITGATDVASRPDGSDVVFTASSLDALEGLPRTCIGTVRDGVISRLTNGEGDDRLPRWSPDGATLAFLSDRAERGVFQLHLLSRGEIGEARAVPGIDGNVEYFSWSPDGTRVLLGVAGRGADLSGGQGSGTLAGVKDDLPSWMPTIEVAVSDHEWRSAWIYDTHTSELMRASRDGTNVWETVWCGPDKLLAVVSDTPGEGAWYAAWLTEIALATGESRVIHRPSLQLGWPAASPGGARIAIVETVCSDRWVVAGKVLLIDPSSESAEPTVLDSASVDVTQLVWRDEQRLFFTGQRGLEVVAGEIDVATGKATELFVSKESCGIRYPDAWPLADGRFVTAIDSYERAPEIVVVDGGSAATLASLDHDGSTWLRTVAGTIEPVSWRAPDGLEIQGLLCRPEPQPTEPMPLVVHVHGGPVWAWRNRWQMGFPWIPLLVSRGYAVLHVNPRGSSGRGEEFAAAVVGDMGGADTYDYLSGIDALVERGVADPARIGVTGGSYGGFMSSWLVTQDTRFAAAVPLAPCSNWYSMHLTSNIPHFDVMFLDDDPYAAGGRYHERSPVMHAAAVRTPVLQVTGALDKCTPAEQAVEFHRALVEHGVTSELAIYPEEGHGVRRLPALIDYSARLVSWFETHMPA